MKIVTGAMQARLFQFSLLVVLSMLSWAGSAHGQYPVFESHVTDAAGVLGSHAVAVDRKLKGFEAATGHKVIVLTVQTSGSQSIDEYAVSVFNEWKVGRKAVDDGVLFVIAVADRKLRIEVGYGLEGTLTDALCSRIIHDVVTPQFAKGNYGLGIQAGVEAILLTLAPPSRSYVAASPPIRADRDEGKYIFLSLLALLLLPAMLASLLGAVAGLLPVGLFALVLPGLYPGWPGWLLWTAVITLWVYGRWALIAKNVRKYHLRRSTNHLATWLKVFFVGFGTGRPQSKREKQRWKSKGSFGWSTSSRSSDGGSSGGGGGGRSGGAGASGGW